MTAVERIKTFLDQRDRMRGLDPDLVYSVQADPEGEPGELRVSDLREVTERLAEALRVARHFGGVDGGHHKAWVIDQMVRCLTGCPTESREGVDHDYVTYTYDVLGESDEYKAFVAEHNDGIHGPSSFSWEEGIAP